MSSFVYLYSLYVHMVKLYLSVFERLLSVTTKDDGSKMQETQV